MSFSASVDLADYIARTVDILQRVPLLLQGSVKILSQEPPIEQSPQTALIPAIFVAQSKQPIKTLSIIGKDSSDTASHRQYSLELYIVIIVREITKQASLTRLQHMEAVIRDTFLKNQRMTDSNGNNPMSLLVDIVSVPYVLRSTNPNIQALNIVIRPEVPVSI